MPEEGGCPEAFFGKQELVFPCYLRNRTGIDIPPQCRASDRQGKKNPSGRVILPDRCGRRKTGKKAMEIAIPDDIEVLPDQGGEVLLLCIEDRREPGSTLSFPGMVDHVNGAAYHQGRDIFRDNKVPCSGDLHGQPPSRTPCSAGRGI
jgi:hypothetical protein